MLRVAETLDDFHAIARIESYLEPDQEHPLEPNTWTETRSASALEAARTILGRDMWPDIIERGLRSEDRHLAWLANDAARRAGIDTYSVHVNKILADPIDGPWFAAWQSARTDTARAAELVSIAIEAFPAERIATGADTSLGLGPEHQMHRALDWTLQELPKHPGLGGDLLLIALSSAVTRNRHFAMRSLEAWPSNTWPDHAVSALQAVASSDPDTQLREAAGALLDL